MAHNNSTPQSILDAPVLQPAVNHEFSGVNRAQRRRHGVNPQSYSRVLPATLARSAWRKRRQDKADRKARDSAREE